MTQQAKSNDQTDRPSFTRTPEIFWQLSDWPLRWFKSHIPILQQRFERQDKSGNCEIEWRDVPEEAEAPAPIEHTWGNEVKMPENITIRMWEHAEREVDVLTSALKAIAGENVVWTDTNHHYYAALVGLFQQIAHDALAKFTPPAEAAPMGEGYCTYPDCDCKGQAGPDGTLKSKCSKPPEPSPQGIDVGEIVQQLGEGVSHDSDDVPRAEALMDKAASIIEHLSAELREKDEQLTVLRNGAKRWQEYPFKKKLEEAQAEISALKKELGRE